MIEELGTLLRTTKFSHASLDRTGISEFSFDYLGKPFRISWYGGTGEVRTIALGEDRMFFTSGDAEFLLGAAVWRAEHISRKRIHKLEETRAGRRVHDDDPAMIGICHAEDSTHEHTAKGSSLGRAL